MPTKQRDASERGQILVIVAVGLVAIIAMVALVIDGGFAWARQRDTQNAADAAAEAGATVLMQNLAGVSPAKTDDDVEDAVNQAADENGTVVDTAFYTDIDGNLLTPAGAITTDDTVAAVVGDGAIPPGAAGVLSRNEQEFDTFLAQIVGIQTFTAREDATAVTGYLEGVCSAAAGCNMLPLTFPVNVFDCNGSNSIVFNSPLEFWQNPSPVLIVPLCSSGPGNVGWIDWTPPGGGTDELRDAILTPSNPALSWPQWFQVTETGGPDGVEAAMRTWDGQRVQIPLFDATCDATPTGPGVTDCPAGALGGNGPDQWTHLAAMTTFELCSSTIPECVTAGYDHGAYIQGSNGTICATGNGATDCLAGRFITTSYTGQVTAAPGPDPNNQTLGIQLIN
ncbi:MAG TPA: pilus assembly protein TadG-related protein [Aeromicrobium sp.]|nr:pilus assembly protein TadG-related protein [Aeromicrobium sp.]